MLDYNIIKIDDPVVHCELILIEVKSFNHVVRIFLYKKRYRKIGNLKIWHNFMTVKIDIDFI